MAQSEVSTMRSLVGSYPWPDQRSVRSYDEVIGWEIYFTYVFCKILFHEMKRIDFDTSGLFLQCFGAVK